ncbi:MAG TPA: NAD-dependent epimerase/dehydratase family protein [Chloroflexota bacterium]|jgi:dTDP-glucose 4,6-dehydratase
MALTSTDPPAGRAVVTGGAGFLGSHLCRRLLVIGCEVVCVDNLITDAESNIGAALEQPAMSFVPIQTLKVGTLGTHNVLGLARAKGARMVLAALHEFPAMSTYH